MKTVSLKLIAKKKKGFEDSILGLVWRTGQTHEIPRDHAQFYLFHSDVWRDQRSATAQTKDPIKPMEFVRQNTVRKEQPPLANFAVMDEKGLRSYAVMHLDHPLPPGMPLEAMRQTVNSLARQQDY